MLVQAVLVWFSVSLCGLPVKSPLYGSEIRVFPYSSPRTNADGNYAGDRFCAYASTSSASRGHGSCNGWACYARPPNYNARRASVQQTLPKTSPETLPKLRASFARLHFKSVDLN